jgi:tetratricopeptide (TPR) repeat protein
MTRCCRSLVAVCALLAIAGGARAAAQDRIALPPLGDLEPAVQDQLRDAREAAERAVSSGSGGRLVADAYGALGQTLHVYEFFEPAEAAYAEALRRAPNEVRWLHLLGYLYQQTGRLQEAAERFGAALRLQPDDHAARLRLGDVLLGMDRPADARQAFQDVLDVYPAAARRGLGDVALRQRQYEEAAGHFRAALERVPQASSLHYSLAMAYRGLGRLDEARRHLEQRGAGGIRAVDPIVDDLQTRVRGERPLVMHGRRAFDAGQFLEAADLFRRAVETTPDSAVARLNLGLAQARLGQLADAARHLDAALSLDPANLEARTSLGMVLIDQGRLIEAVAHLDAVVSRAPGDSAARQALVTALLRQGRKDQVIAVLEQGLTIDNANEDTLVSLAILLADRGRYREAVSRLEDFNRRFPDRAMTATTLARLLSSAPDVSIRDGQRALQLALKVHAADPAPAHAETVALALAEQGRCGEAREWIRRAAGEAERLGDAPEAVRLRSQISRFDAPSCGAAVR